MYRCLACAAPIGWWRASHSSVITPCRCTACATDQYRRIRLLPFLLMYLLAMVAMAFAAVAALEFGVGSVLAWSAFVPAVGVLVGWEGWMYRRGEMLPTLPRRTRIARVFFWLAVAMVVFTLAFAFWIDATEKTGVAA